MSGIAAAAIGAGGAIIGSGINYFKGKSQIDEGKEIAKKNPFQAQRMPDEVKQATELAQQNFTNGMPGMQYAKQGIQQNAGNAFAAASKGASSSGDILDSANKIQSNANTANQDLAMQAASYKSNALGGYEAALNNQAGWQDKLYQNNQLQPYLRAANTAASLIGAGNINESNAIDSAVTGLTAAGQEYGNFKYGNMLSGQTMGQKKGISDLVPGAQAGFKQLSTSQGGQAGLMNPMNQMPIGTGWNQYGGSGVNTSSLIPMSQYYRG
jgi:hypothetical protein